MHSARRTVLPLLGAALLLASVLGVSPGSGSQAHAAAQADQPAGAATPFTTVEAESGTLGGGARMRHLTAGERAPTAATIETEASGYALVELTNTGDSVSIRNASGEQANTLVVRASIPDALNGGGLKATVNLYVDGVYRQPITLSSAQAWNYRNGSTNLDDPHGGGMPFHFYNDFPVWVTGDPIPAGSSITLRKDSGNTAAVYDIDSVDLENVGPALNQPGEALSVVDFGADPTSTKDSTAAIQNTVNAARAQGRPVWIPAGTYLTSSLVSATLDFTGVTVEGAGMWYTTLYHKVPLPSPAGWRSQVLVGSGTDLSDLQIDGNAVWRGTGGGADYGIQSMGALGWHVNRVWTRHTDANWLSGSDGLMENSRTSDSYGDGFNINNGNSADKRGDNVVVRNCFARGTGDDSFATYSDSGADGTNPQIVGAKILDNTAVAPWWANGIRVAGGKDVQVMNNLVNSVSSDSAMDIGVYADSGRPVDSATISGNVLIGGGGWNGARHGVRISSPAASSRFANAYTNVTMTGNTLRGALHAGLFIDRARVNATVTGNTIDGPAEQAILVNAGVAGTGSFTDNTAKNLRSGVNAFVNNSIDFTSTLAGNSWQSNASPVVNDDALAYDTHWNHATNRGVGDLNDDVHHSSTPGAVATYTFSGTGVRYLSERYGDEGTVDVYIDGKFQRTVDLRASGPRQSQVVVFEKTGLTSGQHTFKLVNGSGLGIIDSLYIISSAGGSSGGDTSTRPTGPITGIGGKCVDVAAASSANGTAVQLYDCNGSAAQQWTMTANGSIRALGKCLDLTGAGLSNGTKVQLYDCNGTGAQKWAYDASSRALVNPASGRCLDATGPSSANGTRLQIWDCAGSSNQSWTVPAA